MFNKPNSDAYVSSKPCSLFSGITIIKQVSLNKLSLLLKIILENTQTLQIFTIYRKYSQKLLKMPSWKAWLMRPSGLI